MPAHPFSRRFLIGALLLNATIGAVAWYVHGFWWGVAAFVTYHLLMMPISWSLMRFWAHKIGSSGRPGDIRQLIKWLYVAQWTLLVVFSLSITAPLI